MALAAAGLYSAASIVVRVDSVILPGVDFELPRPVTKVVPGLSATPEEGSPVTDRINILVLGIDRRPHHDPNVAEQPNSDSIHLLSLDPVTRTAAVLTFPRDLYVEMPSATKPGEFDTGRINSAYRLGEEHKYPGGGAALARQTIEHTFHLAVD